jgi:hypothetical protein
VKDFGCRPLPNGSARTVAGIRNPPREETAMRERLVCGLHYGDLSAADEGSAMRERDRRSCWTALRMVSREL